MNTPAQTAEVSSKPSITNIRRSLSRLWYSVINIGITDDLPYFERKSTRLLNSISAQVFLIYFMYVIYAAHLNGPARYVFYECISGAVSAVIPIIFNYYKKYNVARHFFNIYNLFYYLLISILEGGRDNVECIFIPLCVASMLFFKSFRVIFCYFFVTAIFFAIAKICQANISPVFLWEGQAQQGHVNWIIMFVILFLILYYFKSQNEKQEKLLEDKNESISAEKQRSDNLLMNILPFETAEELKYTGTARPRSFKMVTVMFTDFKGFTQLAESLHPEQLVSEIHYYFSVFDQIMSKYNIEKIKTIGDSYMCAAGLPEENTTNAEDMVNAGLEIQAFMAQIKQEKEARGEMFFECRLGIHTGPVTAGIVGTKKFAYDIWGDTVNVAARMESSGIVGKVNISGSTFNLVKERFTCLHRGKIAAKNKGEVDMYFVESSLSNL